MVERYPDKIEVVGSIPTTRTNTFPSYQRTVVLQYAPAVWELIEYSFFCSVPPVNRTGVRGRDFGLIGQHRYSPEGEPTYYLSAVAKSK